MLGKLLKYEFKSTGRVLVVFYIALLALSIINRVTAAFDGNHGGMNVTTTTTFMLTMLLYGIAIASVFIITGILILTRFHKNLLQNEGYLMHTLPVKTWQLITSKLITSLVWCVVSGIAVIISVLIVGTNDMNILALFKSLWSDFATALQLANVSIVTMLLLTCLLALAYGGAIILQLYASMAVGQISDRHKILFSFGTFIAFNIVLHVIELAGLKILTYLDIAPALRNMFDTLEPISVTNIGILFMIILMLIRCAVFFAITHYFMHRKLNLE